MKASVLQCIRLHKAYLINIELSMQSADWSELQTQLTHAQHTRSWVLLQSRNKHVWTYFAHLQSQTAGPLDKSDQSSAFAHRLEVCSAQTRTRGVQIRKWSDKNKGYFPILALSRTARAKYKISWFLVSRFRCTSQVSYHFIKLLLLSSKLRNLKEDEATRESEAE